jgi:hypothetical protein
MPPLHRAAPQFKSPNASLSFAFSLSLSLSLSLISLQVMSFLALSSASCVRKLKTTLSLSLSLSISQRILSLCGFYDLILNGMNQPLIISRAHLTVKPSATCRTKAFPYSSFAPENPLLFRDSPFNEQILFLFIILLFSSFSIHDNQLSNSLIKLYFLFFIYF